MADGEADYDKLYLPRQEFYDYARSYDKQLSELRLDIERTRAKLEHLPDDVRGLAAEMRGSLTAINQGMAALSQKVERAPAPVQQQPIISAQEIAALLKAAPRGSLTPYLMTFAGGGGVILWLYTTFIK